jgi:outer membrane protein insertion porin family
MMKTLSLLLALWLSPLGAQTLQTPDPNRIESVLVGGNRRIPSDTIRYNLQSKAGDLFNPAIIARDVKTLYALGYFEDVRVEEEQGQRGKIVRFVVDEKPLMRSVEFEGIKSITRSEILDKLRERKASLGQNRLTTHKVRRAEGVIKEMLAEKGRQNGTVEATVEDIPQRGSRHVRG